ncbi:MAG: hypothetical protein FJ128_10370 [Deltaproteobacteria bacterium]|nr:hypothetical protein [Deltaproteobacteria bacterium]
MNLALDIDIREQLARYLVGEISFQEFEDWFVPASWNVVQGKNVAAINIVYEIELWLAEFSDGFWSEAELKEKLFPLVNNYKIDIAMDQWQSGVSNHNVRWFQSQLLFSGIQYAVEYV